MNETKYLLDTSAILAFMKDEDGAERVEEILKQEQAIIPFPVFLEAYYISLQERSEAIADRRYAMMRQLPVTEIWTTNEPTLLTAARIKANFRVSFADALIAAFAVQNEAILVHKDPELDALQGKVQQETLPYK